VRRVKRVTGATVAAVVIGGVLAVSGCSSDEDTNADTSKAKGSASPAVPSRAFVVWADGMCESTAGFETLKEESAEDIKEVTDPSEDAIMPTDMAADSYLSSTSLSLNTVTQGLDGIRKTGITAADRLHDRLAEDIGKTAAEADELSDFLTLYDLSEKQKIDRAERLAGLVDALKMPKPGLQAVVAGDPRLKAAHGLAPRCVPPTKPSPTASGPGPTSPSPSSPGPLPKAEDGKDTSACKDGNCEILVTKPVDFTVGDWDLHVTVKDSTVTVTNSDSSGFVSNMSFGDGGGGAFSTAGGKETTVDGTAVNEKGAVLKFSTK
jgi:PBP1b-binding outer membrane lipoprotein LpoB